MPCWGRLGKYLSGRSQMSSVAWKKKRSFLKKRTKKLLAVAYAGRGEMGAKEDCGGENSRNREK
jgi:hypothetical protein